MIILYILTQPNCHNVSARWIYRYTIHQRRRKIGLRALRHISLKQTRAARWRSVFPEARDPIKSVR